MNFYNRCPRSCTKNLLYQLSFWSCHSKFKRKHLFRNSYWSMFMWPLLCHHRIFYTLRHKQNPHNKAVVRPSLLCSKISCKFDSNSPHQIMDCGALALSSTVSYLVHCTMQCMIRRANNLAGQYHYFLELQRTLWSSCSF